MKKLYFLIPLVILFSSFFVVSSKAAEYTASQYGWYIVKDQNNRYNWHFLIYTFTTWVDGSDNQFFMCRDIQSGTKDTYDDAYNTCEYYASNFDYWASIRPLTSTDYNGFSDHQNYTGLDIWYFNVPFRNLSGANVFDPNEPPEPVPSDTWLSDMWEWFLWQLGLNDDYSGDIDEFITGGDRERMELVTPTPSPTPTPRPSPTPFSVDVVDPNTGQPVYTITGIPGNYTYNYYEGDTSNGSDFDIFEVDLQVGDGGSSNPRDGINSVMDSNYDYLEDVDITPVSGSFSVLPADWYLLIGVLISFPVIAGFISKLLK